MVLGCGFGCGCGCGFGFGFRFAAAHLWDAAASPVDITTMRKVLSQCAQGHISDVFGIDI